MNSPTAPTNTVYRKPLIFAAFALATALSLTGGCATKQPVRAWRSGMQQQIQRAGDINRLIAEASTAPSGSARRGRIIFRENVSATNGSAQFGGREAVGILLGQREISGRSWHLFLVGVVNLPSTQRPFAYERATLTDARVVALAQSGDELRWMIGKQNDEAIDLYNASRRAQDTDIIPAASSRLLFPGRSDRFDLELQGGTVEVREARSGATWRLTVARTDNDRRRHIVPTRRNQPPEPVTRFAGK